MISRIMITDHPCCRIPVWIINATYIGPAALYLYYRYGRPAHPREGVKGPSCHQSSEAKDDTIPVEKSCHAHKEPEPAAREPQPPSHCCAHESAPTPDDSPRTLSSSGDIEKQPHSHNTHSNHHASNARPFWATVLVGVSHCGAGCVLGDLVGEWLVYGTSASISGQMIWPALLIDYAFALLFGIVFQYFSIAPMSGEYGPKTVWRAAKADVLSLTSFEVGAFGWMVIYQVGIWDYRLDMASWTYWWMMQLGMAMGFVTAAPVNWWLLKKGIKEPCC